VIARLARRVLPAFTLGLALLAGAPARAKDLRWSSLDVQARLDANGDLRVVERHAMVFNGDWNGGERIFRLFLGQSLTLESVGRYYERVLGRKADLQIEHAPPGPLLEELIGGIYPQKARLLGQRTGELHLALASDPDDRAFSPEPFNALSQRSVYQNMRASLRKAFALLQKKLPDLSEGFREEAKEVLAAEQKILAQEQRILDQRSAASKIRIHGDYHLGQALYTGKDFVILDFEGEPARPLSERKLKRSALRDVAGMMRSFQYAAYSALWQPAMRPEDIPFLERWADLWYRQMSSVFLQSYLKTTRGASFIPPRESDLEVLLQAYLLDKAVYEVGYELNNRPAWVVIPIRGIKHILAAM